MLAAIFVSGGVDALRAPQARVAPAEKVAPKLAAKIPYLPEDTETLVKINAAAQIGAGSMLALGKLPRLSALALIATLVPTTAAGHRFWEYEDAAQRGNQRYHFLKNVGLLGGLLLAAVDTEGRPSIGYRARQVGRAAQLAASTSGRVTGRRSGQRAGMAKVRARAAARRLRG